MKIALILVALALAGCQEKKPVAATTTDNPNFVVERLFDHDGCTMYRFHDGGYPRYFVKCQGGDSRTEWTQPCGKNCTRRESIVGGTL